MNTATPPVPSRHELSQRFHFDAAHTLRREIEAASSRRVHGHTYTAEVAIAGTPDAATGMVVDLGHLRREIAIVRDKLDHHFLDDVPGLAVPTLEGLCTFLWTEFAAVFPGLVRVSVGRDASGDRCTLHR